MRVLRRYDVKPTGISLVEEIPGGAYFKTNDGRIFQKGERLRKRYRCIEKNTGLVYLFSPLYEVKMIG